jgi:[acyl-carrier-protein] S-malonyltransferase
MGKDFFEKFEVARSLYTTADAQLGYTISEVSFEGPEEELKQTKNTQPALFVHSLVIARLLEERGLRAAAAAGHSLGEFSALVYGGAFSFEAGLDLVKERARLMQHAGEENPGTMAAIIGLEAEDVMGLCIESRDVGIVQPANYNAPGQVVVSGAVEGVDRAMELAKERGAKRAIKLPVSGAFHSPLMASAVNHFGELLQKTEVHNPKIPVYANVTAAAVSNPEEIRNLLHHQLTHSVRWVETIQNMVAIGISRFVEVGAGKVLSGLVKRIHRDAELFHCGTVEEFEALV